MQTWITTRPIDTQDVLSAVADPANGAVLLFLGVVRERNDGRAVSAMEYSAYTEMAVRVLHDITTEAAARLGSERIAVVHRTGELRVGEASVAIAVGGEHRAEAFDACRFVIEQIKVRLPVWKREHYEAGVPRWLEGAAPSVEQAVE